VRHLRCVGIGLLTAALWITAAPAAAADDAEARLLVQKTLEALPNVPFTAQVRMTGDVRGERKLLFHHKVIEGARATYLEVVAPEFLVGMRFLFRERIGRPPEQHMRYVASRMPVLIASEARAEPFLGSTFYLLDLVEPDLNSFDYRFVGTDTVAGRSCKLVESLPKSPEKEVYGKTIHAIDPKDLIVLRRKLFDKKGQPLKEWSGTKIEKVDGHWTVLDQRMKNLPREMESRIEITEIKYGAEIPEAVFSTDYLVR
jgi:hypothetical protein